MQAREKRIGRRLRVNGNASLQRAQWSTLYSMHESLNRDSGMTEGRREGGQAGGRTGGREGTAQQGKGLRETGERGRGESGRVNESVS